MNSQEKIGGQATACQDVADILSGFAYGDSRLSFQYMNNRFASPESKKAFELEVDRIVRSLRKRQVRLMKRFREQNR